MAFNPADYEATRRGYINQYGTTTAMRSYANFLSQQRGNRERSNMLKQYEQAQPQLVSAYSRRGMTGPNVRSGIFAKGLQDFAAQRASNIHAYDQSQLEQDRMFQLEEDTRLAEFKNQLLDIESGKAQTIANAARQLYEQRMGLI